MNYRNLLYRWRILRTRAVASVECLHLSQHLESVKANLSTSQLQLNMSSIAYSWETRDSVAHCPIKRYQFHANVAVGLRVQLSVPGRRAVYRNVTLQPRMVLTQTLKNLSFPCLPALETAIVRIVHLAEVGH